MSKEVILYNRIDRALARIKDRVELMKTPALSIEHTRRGPKPIASPLWTPREVDHGDEIDLIQVCAVHDRMFGLRFFMMPDGKLKFSGSTFRITEDAYRTQYEGNPQVEVELEYGVEAPCGWCSVISSGVLCRRCGFEVCMGRSIDGKYFRCRRSCGEEGKITIGDWKHKGIIPAVW